MRPRLMSKNFITLFVFFGLLFFWFSSKAQAQQVRIDNFNVVQRTIPSTASSVDFRLTISQQDQSLDCSNLPFTNGRLQWEVWYETSLTSGKYSVRTNRADPRSTSLPLSPNPLNLDFNIPNFVPNSSVVQAGSVNFYAAAGCTVYVNSADRNRNLAVSSPIRVTIVGGGQQPPGGGQQPGQPVSVSFNIENPIQSESLIDLAKAIGRFLFQIGIPIAVIVIIYSGILFLTSGGNKEKITKARQALWYAVIGLAIILIGQGFFTLIKSILDLGG